MKKSIFVITGILVLALALGSTSQVFAQTETPQTAAAGYANGYGMGGRGARGGAAIGQGPMANSQDGVLHDGMIEVYAAEFGLSVEELNAKLAAGETLSDIAFAAGLTADEFSALKVDARAAAVDQAVADGTLTQEQADWMKSRSAGAMRGGFGARGAGLGLNADPDCPYYGQIQP